MPAAGDSRDAVLREARASLQRGDAATAEALSRNLIASNASDAGAWLSLGIALRHRDPDGAEEALRRALALDAGNVDARFHLANVLRVSGRHQDAIAEYRAILARAPTHPSVLNNLGLALLANGDAPAAERAFRDVLGREPDHAQALINLVHLLCRERRHGEALEHGARYLRRNADAPAEFWIDMGISHHAQHQSDAAVASFRRALGVAADDPVALLDLAVVMVDMGAFEEAAPVLAQARRVAPEDLHVLSLLAYTQQHLCDWAGLAALHAALEAGIAADAQSRISPFVTLSMPLSAAQQQLVAGRWSAGVHPPIVTAAPADPRAWRPPARGLPVVGPSRARAGIPCCRGLGAARSHAHLRFSVCHRSAGRLTMRARLQSAFEVFRDMHAAPDRAVVEQIRADGIDVLIDLNGYTTHARSEILAARPAPVQAQWLGYLGTMGAPWMDYVITDRYVCPPEAQAHFDERFLYLPECYCPSDTRRAVAPAPGRGACGLPADGIVFCCFNNTYKLLPATFDIWMRLLRAVPGSVLWLSPSSEVAMHHLRAEAVARNVDATRLVFAPRVPLDVHLARHAHADLYLDTWPYNAGTAANDALFMGLPVLTCSGETMASRVAGSQLHAIGLAGLVTGNPGDYEARALELAMQPALLRDAREALREHRGRFPLFDMARFTAGFESALTSIARRSSA